MGPLYLRHFVISHRIMFFVLAKFKLHRGNREKFRTLIFNPHRFAFLKKALAFFKN